MNISIRAFKKALAARAKKVIAAKAHGVCVSSDFIDLVSEEATRLLHKHNHDPLISARVLSAIVQRELDARDNPPVPVV